MGELPEYVDGLPNLCGSERLVEAAIRAGRDWPVFGGPRSVDLAGIDSAFAVALHMHQPLIPAGGPDPRTAAIVSNLQWMLEHPELGDNHNAPVFHRCYQRMGELIPQLLGEGRQPRIMLEYSGTLLHGLRRAGLDDVFDALRPLTSDPDLRQAVEWLGCPWGHAVAPSTPVQDYRLHVRAWQHHFAASFGLEALGRVRGFSPAEMALPNHPDVAYEFVKTLNDCGFEWLLVQEHTVELPDGRPLEHPHLPHRLVATSSHGDTAEIVAVVKTQGSDTKLVAQMQPYYQAKGLSRSPLAGRNVPPLVTQIADGENGGVMMNEFPPKYLEVVRECSGSRTPMLNVTEYLQQLFASGIQPADLPVIQPLFQQRIWQQMTTRRRPRPARQRHRPAAARGRPLPRGRWQLDQRPVLGARLRPGPDPDGAGQLTVPQADPGSWSPQRRPPVPQGPVPPAVGRDKLLPLLGAGDLDRLRRRAIASRRRHHHAFGDLTPTDQPAAMKAAQAQVWLALAREPGSQGERFGHPDT
jgi:hypothetical protein